ncbi:metal ABC transporter substrate-binding protein [Bacillus massiliglaciei]|uniref:metal ABC transporter substrate-binding protein n=1 Tax=Bacillus massiliglaciei TaxID=1816693 RepID=UPI000B267449|nr:metal ABC transporter substrate-binding protein [Bacillus massiliglaciei]
MKKMKNLLAPLLAVPLILAGCQEESSKEKTQEKKDKVHIVTSFYPRYEFTKNVAGDLAEVDLLIPSSIEPHDWEPTPKDIGNIQQADLFVYDSEYMETWVPDMASSLDSDTILVKASEGISLMDGQEEHEHEHEGEEGEHEESSHEEGEEHEHHHEKDPHVWLSPVLAQKEVMNITNALIEKDPDNEKTYRKNSDDYISQLKELDQQFKNTLSDVPNKEIITQHAAFGYLADEYGLEQVAIAGLSPENEPSPAKLGELKEFAKEHEISTIFFEETASPKVAQTLADEIGADTEVLNTLEGLSEEDQKNGADYISIMNNNLEKLKNALEK